MALKPTLKSVVTITSAGTAYALAGSTSYTAEVTIMADPSNTGIVYVGDSSVSSTNGMGALSAKDSMILDHSVRGGVYDSWDLSQIYVTSTANSDKVRIMTSDKF